MNKPLSISLAMVILSSCGSDQTPTPQKLTQNIKSLPSPIVISVVAKNSFAIPKDSQIIQQFGEFKTIDNTYDYTGNEVLIPRDAIFKGSYVNDGVNCKVTWEVVYINQSEYKKSNGSSILSTATVPSICNPLQGIKTGDRLTIQFNNNV